MAVKNYTGICNTKLPSSTLVINESNPVTFITVTDKTDNLYTSLSISKLDGNRYGFSEGHSTAEKITIQQVFERLDNIANLKDYNNSLTFTISS